MSIVSTHSRPKAADPPMFVPAEAFAVVSTHSRPKAAGLPKRARRYGIGFNTQPPEGGCIPTFGLLILSDVSTHSRPKAAVGLSPHLTSRSFGFNTQPPEGG